MGAGSDFVLDWLSFTYTNLYSPFYLCVYVRPYSDTLIVLLLLKLDVIE